MYLLISDAYINWFPSRIGHLGVGNTELAEGYNKEHVSVPCFCANIAEYILASE